MLSQKPGQVYLVLMEQTQFHSVLLVKWKTNSWRFVCRSDINCKPSLTPVSTQPKKNSLLWEFRRIENWIIIC